MDFQLTEEQLMLRKSARDFLSIECTHKVLKEMAQKEAGYSTELWSKMANLGWMGLVFPEIYGGSGGSFFDLGMLLEEMGRVCLPSPFLNTIISGLLIQELGSEKQKWDLLPKIADGSLIVTLATVEPGGDYGSNEIEVEASDKGTHYSITGTKVFVPYAQIAGELICVCKTQKGISLILVNGRTPGIRFTSLKTVAPDSFYEVVFDNVQVPPDRVLGVLDQGWEKIETASLKAVVANCFEMIGGAQKVLEISVDHAKQRVQFDHPIGSFQAVQHHCANMLIDVESSRYITYEAGSRLSQGLQFTKEAAMAKAWVSNAYKRVTMTGHQIIGAMAFADDHILSIYYRHAKSAESMFGDVGYHQEIVAQKIGLEPVLT